MSVYAVIMCPNRMVQYFLKVSTVINSFISVGSNRHNLSHGPNSSHLVVIAYINTKVIIFESIIKGVIDLLCY